MFEALLGVTIVVHCTVDGIYTVLLKKVTTAIRI